MYKQFLRGSRLAILVLVSIACNLLAEVNLQRRVAIVVENGEMEGPGREYDLFMALAPVALQEAKTPIIVSTPILRGCVSRNKAMRQKWGLSVLIEKYEECVARAESGEESRKDLYQQMYKAEEIFAGAGKLRRGIARHHIEYGLIDIDFNRWQVFQHGEWYLLIPRQYTERLTQQWHAAGGDAHASIDTILGFNTHAMKSISSMEELERVVDVDVQKAFERSSDSWFTEAKDDVRCLVHCLCRDMRHDFAKQNRPKWMVNLLRDPKYVDLDKFKEMFQSDGNWNILLAGHGWPSRIKFINKSPERDPRGQMSGLSLAQMKETLSFFRTIGTRSLLICTCFGGGYHTAPVTSWLQEQEAAGDAGSYPVMFDTHTDSISRPPARQIGSMHFVQDPDQFMSLSNYFTTIERSRVLDEDALRRSLVWVADRRLEDDVMGTMQQANNHPVDCACDKFRWEPSNLPMVRLPGASRFEPLSKELMTIDCNGTYHVDPTIRVVRLETDRVCDLTVPVTTFACGKSKKLSSLVAALPGSMHVRIGQIIFDMQREASLPGLARFLGEVIFPIPVVYAKLFSIEKITCAHDFVVENGTEIPETAITIHNMHILKDPSEEDAPGTIIFVHNGIHYKAVWKSLKESTPHLQVEEISTKAYNAEFKRMRAELNPPSFWKNPILG